jgi:soluble lytic murein transglycosylase-like protein
MTKARSAFRKGAAGAFVLASLALAAAQAKKPFPPQPAADSPRPPLSEGTSASPPRSDPVARWRPFIEEASRRFGVPIAWIERVMRAESGGFVTLNGRPITSPAGAMGLMQLMPATWAEMRARYGLGSDPFDPRDSILAGTAFLAEMHARFGYPGLFGAYNAGPARYADWLAGRSRLPAETRLYLARVATEGAVGRPDETAVSVAAVAPVSSARGRLFAVDRAAAGGSAVAERRAANGLFVSLANTPLFPSEDR